LSGGRTHRPAAFRPRRRFQFCIQPFQSFRRLFLQLCNSRGAPQFSSYEGPLNALASDDDSWELRFGQLPSRPPSAARTCTRCCRFGASEPIPFPGADSIFSRRCGAISGPVRQPLAPAIPATATPRFERSSIGSAAASSATATQEPTRIEFPSAFRDFSRSCKAENFPSGRNAAPLCRSTGVRRWRKTTSATVSSPMLSRIVPCARRCAWLVAAI